MKATVVNNVENTTRTLELNANVTDVATLKNFLGVTDGRIFEGVTHTDLDNDNAPLPQLPEDRRERGYVFFVSPAQNKTKNGAYTRKECYDFIRSHGLQDAVKAFFGGRNFTQVSTDGLNDFISSHSTFPVNSTPSSVQSTATQSTVSSSQEGSTYTEKDLWKEFINEVCPVDKVQKFNDIVDKVFPNPYSVQDIANMRK